MHCQIDHQRPFPRTVVFQAVGLLIPGEDTVSLCVTVSLGSWNAEKCYLPCDLKLFSWLCSVQRGGGLHKFSSCQMSSEFGLYHSARRSECEGMPLSDITNILKLIFHLSYLL